MTQHMYLVDLVSLFITLLISLILRSLVEAISRLFRSPLRDDDYQ